MRPLALLGFSHATVAFRMLYPAIWHNKCLVLFNVALFVHSLPFVAVTLQSLDFVRVCSGFGHIDISSFLVLGLSRTASYTSP